MAEEINPADAGAPTGGATGQNAANESDKATEQQPPKGNEDDRPGGFLGGAGGGLLIPIIFMFVVMYFLVIRPQKKKERRRRELLSSVRANDDIVTIGGIHGTVTSVKEEEVIVRVDDQTKLRFNRSSVARIIRDGEDIAEQS